MAWSESYSIAPAVSSLPRITDPRTTAVHRRLGASQRLEAAVPLHAEEKFRRRTVRLIAKRTGTPFSKDRKNQSVRGFSLNVKCAAPNRRHSRHPSVESSFA